MTSATPTQASTVNYRAYPDETGHFGPYGGKFVPETLMPALEELEEVYLKAAQRQGVSGGTCLSCSAPLSAGPRRSPMPAG